MDISNCEICGTSFELGCYTCQFCGKIVCVYCALVLTNIQIYPCSGTICVFSSSPISNPSYTGFYKPSDKVNIVMCKQCGDYLKISLRIIAGKGVKEDE